MEKQKKGVRLEIFPKYIMILKQEKSFMQSRIPHWILNQVHLLPYWDLPAAEKRLHCV